MNSHTQKTFKVRLHVVSPIHIGCDDAYEPTGFVVDRGARTLVAFDPVDFVQGLDKTDQQKFLTICEKGTLGSLVELYKFMDGRKAAARGRRVDITEGFLASYDRVLRIPPGKDFEIKQELNKFLIARTSYLPRDHAPYIPGTSLKGALRTGWLNHLNRGVAKRVDQRQAKELEKDLLGGGFAADPMRMVKVSDLLPVGQPRTVIRFAVNKKRKASKHEARGPQQILEVLPHGQGIVFEGLVTLSLPERGASIVKAVPADLSFFQAATAFFKEELAGEEAMLRDINLPVGIDNQLRQRFGNRYLESVFPVRLGRHSGAEAVTIKGARSIKILGKKGDPPKQGPVPLTTWLAGDSPKATTGLQPFGWAALEILAPSLEALWPERQVTERPAEARPQAIAMPPAAPTILAETLVWEQATLTWNPGNAILTVAGPGGTKANLKLSGDRSLVPEALHKTLFDKKKPAPAKVILKKEGNLFQIVGIEPM